MEIQSEAKLTTFEAICMIVGNSIGTGIIAVPYLATQSYCRHLFLLQTHDLSGSNPL